MVAIKSQLEYEICCCVQEKTLVCFSIPNDCTKIVFGTILDRHCC